MEGGPKVATPEWYILVQICPCSKSVRRATLTRTIFRTSNTFRLVKDTIICQTENLISESCWVARERRFYCQAKRLTPCGRRTNRRGKQTDHKSAQLARENNLEHSYVERAWIRAPEANRRPIKATPVYQPC